MKRTTLRAAGISALAAIALGVAAPAATAATEAPARTVSVAQTANAQQATRSLSLSMAGNTAAPALSGSTAGEVGTQGLSAIVKAAWEAIKKAGLTKKALAAAKKGQTGFTKWVDSLSNFNPAKWAIKALPGYAVQELISYILNNA
ncbi:hypothetical protein OG402_41745 [Streptomyces anulatus]|uniref:hypothetical protein n=1 Tax=Streptomyces anulatus TaxID=1892 RepID=UPI002255BDB0|nr:hypothetical protein [Streptomyces anulatus]MCX4523633.1 hypothetical protein [Streptomyces anulatus]MCX4523762.1 hypothetical protein [Streptomyces anulatus]MCX4606728.1 hypothetical protein [Streptomyces anulatus]MCX4606951.1 hypothetical protein [Streptomyces anulatus]WTD15360.1 hypothetical protein OHA54_39510 [Streptomyces anulatus]